MSYEIFAYTVKGKRHETKIVTHDLEHVRKKIMQQTGCNEVYLEYICKN